MCPQDRTQQILLSRLEALGGAVTRPCELVSFVEASDGIEAELRENGLARRVRARWLWAATGCTASCANCQASPSQVPPISNPSCWPMSTWTGR